LKQRGGKEDWNGGGDGGRPSGEKKKPKWVFGQLRLKKKKKMGRQNACVFRGLARKQPKIGGRYSGKKRKKLRAGGACQDEEKIPPEGSAKNFETNRQPDWLGGRDFQKNQFWACPIQEGNKRGKTARSEGESCPNEKRLKQSHTFDEGETNKTVIERRRGGVLVENEKEKKKEG